MGRKLNEEEVESRMRAFDEAINHLDAVCDQPDASDVDREQTLRAIAVIRQASENWFKKMRG